MTDVHSNPSEQTVNDTVSDDSDRRDKKETISELIKTEGVPADGTDPEFEAPWQARAFGLAVALAEERLYEWGAFQERLVDEIARDESEMTPGTVESDYYGQWLIAFERLLLEEGHLHREEIERRANEFDRGDRTAEEFVEGHHDH